MKVRGCDVMKSYIFRGKDCQVRMVGYVCWGSEGITKLWANAIKVSCLASEQFSNPNTNPNVKVCSFSTWIRTGCQSQDYYSRYWFCFTIFGMSWGVLTSQCRKIMYYRTKMFAYSYGNTRLLLDQFPCKTLQARNFQICSTNRNNKP